MKHRAKPGTYGSLLEHWSRGVTKVVAPLTFIFGRYFSYFLKSVSVKFQVIPRTFAPAQK